MKVSGSKFRMKLRYNGFLAFSLAFKNRLYYLLSIFTSQTYSTKSGIPIFLAIIFYPLQKSSHNHLPANLLYLRKKKGLLQEDMQLRVGIQRTTWSNYENGITDPSVADLVIFSNFFGISLDDLITADLAAHDAHEQPGKRKPKRKPYPIDTDTTFLLQDSGQDAIVIILRELKKLREEVNELKGKKTKAKKVTVYKKGTSK